MALKLGVYLVSIALENVFIDLEVAPVHCVLDRPHLLFGLRVALKIEVGSVFAQNFEHFDRA